MDYFKIVITCVLLFMVTNVNLDAAISYKDYCQEGSSCIVCEDGHATMYRCKYNKVEATFFCTRHCIDEHGGFTTCECGVVSAVFEVCTFVGINGTSDCAGAYGSNFIDNYLDCYAQIYAPNLCNANLPTCVCGLANCEWVIGFTYRNLY